MADGTSAVEALKNVEQVALEWIETAFIQEHKARFSTVPWSF